MKLKRFLTTLFVIAYVLGKDPIPGPIDDILMMIAYSKYNKSHASPYKKEYYRQFNKFSKFKKFNKKCTERF